MKTILSGFSACALAGLVGPVWAENTSSNQYTLEIERQPILAALTEFSRQTGLQVGYLPGSEQEEATVVAALKGQYTAESALHELLAPSGLSFERVNDKTLAVTAPRSASAGRAKKSGAGKKIRLAQSEGSSSAASRDQELSERSADSNKKSASLEEVIVTAQKRRESIQDAALSISVLTSEIIERRSMVSLEDSVKYVPGVSLYNKGVGWNSITIRGVGADVSFAAVDPTTGIYLNDIPLTVVGGSNWVNIDLKLVDIERVEVLRGPQGTLYGSGSMGGTLRYVTNAPDPEAFGGELAVGYSNTDINGGDNSQVTAVVNIPLVKESLALRIAGYYFDNSGYVDYVGARGATAARAALAAANGASILEGDDAGASENAGGRVSLLWKPVEELSATLTYVNQQLDQSGFPEESARLPPYHDFPLSFGDLTPGGREGYYSDTEGLNLSIEWELDKLSVVSSTSHFDLRGGERRDGSRLIPFSAGIFQDADSRATAQEIRASSKFTGPLNFLAGAYYEDTEYEVITDVVWLGADALCCARFGNDPENMSNGRIVDSIEQKAVFSELYFDLADRTKLTLGGRYFEFDRSLFSLQSGQTRPTVETRIKSSESGTTLKANLSYAPSEESLVYLQWAQGFRLGKPVIPPPPQLCDRNNDGIFDGPHPIPLDVRQLKSDTVDSWELGGKFTLLDRRLVVNSAIYHIRWQDLPAGVVGVPPCAQLAHSNAAEARSRGVEIESTLALTRHLLVNVGASIVDAELTKNALLLGGAQGDPLPGSAGFQGNFGLQYQFDLSGYAGFVRADYSYVDGYYINFAETGPELANYGKVDMRAGVDLGNYEVALYGTNITNADPLTAGDPFGRSWRMRPRVIGVDVRYSF